MYLTQGLHRAVQRFPNKVALRHLDGGNATRLSFAALGTQVGQRAAWLQQRGIAPGDRGGAAFAQPERVDRLALGLLVGGRRGLPDECALERRRTAPRAAGFGRGAAAGRRWFDEAGP
jgi:non-ribosomal peptide synthetase component E (peptide arylation enzyme)